jgi:hypothetical protein
MVWRIIQLLISVGLILGGLSGDLVLRGTDSSGALVIFGIGWLIYDIYQLVKYKNENTGVNAEISAALERSRPLTESAEIVFKSEAIDKSIYRFLFSNNDFVKGIPAGESDTITTNQSVNVLSLIAEKNGATLNVFIVNISEGETKKVSCINEQFVLK